MVRSSDFSQYELITILEAIESAGECGTQDDLRAVLNKAREVIGADFAISGVCTLTGGEVSGVDVAANAGYPEEFVDLYLSGRYHRSDPVVRYLSRFSFTQSWSEIFEKTADAGSAPVRHVVGTAYDFGLRHGISTGVYMPGSDRLNVFSFASPRDLFGGHQKKLLDVLALHLNKAMAGAVGSRPGTDEQKGTACGRIQG